MTQNASATEQYTETAEEIQIDTPQAVVLGEAIDALLGKIAAQLAG